MLKYHPHIFAHFARVFQKTYLFLFTIELFEWRSEVRKLLIAACIQKKYSELSEWRSNIWCIFVFLDNVETNPQQGGRPSESRLVKKCFPSGRLSPNRRSNRPSFQWPSRQTALPQKACSRRPDWELCWVELKSRFKLEDQKESGRFGAGRPDWELW